jgi:hypothetical protein
MPDRFSLELPSFKQHKKLLWDEVECTCEMVGDSADARGCEVHGKPSCLYCSKSGGVPWLMVGNDLHCSRCFEDMSVPEFREWLRDRMETGPELYVTDEQRERESVVSMVKNWHRRGMGGAGEVKTRKVA